MPKPTLQVNNIAVTDVPILADGVNYVIAKIDTSPARPGVVWTIEADGLMPVDAVSGILDNNGEACVTFGPARLRGKVTAKLSVPNWNKLDFTVSIT